MKGLLVKDFKFIKVQKNFFFMILAIAVVLSVFYDKATFALGFLTFAASLFVLTTINYDEFDNGNAFLFTLPVSRKGYVVSKYVFAVLLGISTWIFAAILTIAFCAVKGTISIADELVSAAMLLPVIFLLQAVMLPFQIKFGGEKGRIALLGAIGLFAAVGVIFVKITELSGIDLLNIINTLPTLSMGMLVAMAAVITVIIFCVSMRISISIMDKKEF